MSETKICEICVGKKVMILFPMNWIAPCVGCSASLTLNEIEGELHGKFVKREGKWTLELEADAPLPAGWAKGGVQSCYTQILTIPKAPTP